MLEDLRILMLEDSITGAFAVQREIRRTMAEPFALRHEQEREGFVRALHQFRPHLVLTDGLVPGLDAAAALRLVRETLPGAAVIVVSGDLGERAARLVAGGAFGCVFKHRIADLGPMLHRALARIGATIQVRAPVTA